MTGRLIISVLINSLLSASLFSQTANVTIFGNNKEYAGKDLDFFIYTERILGHSESLSKTQVDSTGSFSVSFSIETINCIYCQTPLYTAYIFAEPGKSYHVNLPPTSVFSAENNKNPFFIPPLWQMLPITGPGEKHPGLNAAIDTFNKLFDPFLDTQMLLYYDPQHNREKLDSFILACNSLPEPVQKEYFQSYRLYKYATLGFSDSQFNYSKLYDLYLKNKPVLTNVPSWWEFFNLYFDGYFSSLSTKKEFSELYSLIGKGNYFALNQLLKKDSALQNNQLREWAILKEIHKEFYQNGLPIETLFALCDSISTGSADKLSQCITGSIKNEASSLQMGHIPPRAYLMDSQGDSIEISSLRGKYNYIGFCSLDNLGCLKEFEYLKYFFHKHGQYLNLVIILPEEEKERISSFTYENSIPWDFWYGLNEKKMLKDYKVMAFPVFYLLDREGKLLMSPAVLPSAGFEMQLFHILKGKGDI